jgi:hypothetical protein
MMHDVHAAIPAPLTPAGLDADVHDRPAPADGRHDGRPSHVWWTLMDFVRATLEAKANAAGAAKFHRKHPTH